MPEYPQDWNQRRKRVYRRDNYQCQRCGAKGGPYGDVELHAHHEQSVSRGGSHEMQNLKTLCKSCHEGLHGHRIPTGSTKSQDLERVRRRIRHSSNLPKSTQKRFGKIALIYILLFIFSGILIDYLEHLFPILIVAGVLGHVGYIALTQHTTLKADLWLGSVVPLISISGYYFFTVADVASQSAIPVGKTEETALSISILLLFAALLALAQASHIIYEEF